MCQPILLQEASNHGVHQSEDKITEMNNPAGDLVDSVADGDGHREDAGADAPPPEEKEAKKAAPWSSAFSLPKLAELREKLAGVNRAGAVAAGLGLVGSAVGAYLLLHATAGAAVTTKTPDAEEEVATAVTMKAPDAPGFLISRAKFEANSKLYFKLLRTVGPREAAARFAV
ncbi:hypothetical protein ACP70R_048561 [Stipagrostis hirtigluma subsp. patula]